jgi:hypothetical protein
MDALNFAGAGIGTSVNVNSPVRAINGVKVPNAFYDTAFASQMHTYKVVWTPTSVAWLVDTGACVARALAAARMLWCVGCSSSHADMHTRAPAPSPAPRSCVPQHHGAHARTRGGACALHVLCSTHASMRGARACAKLLLTCYAASLARSPARAVQYAPWRPMSVRQILRTNRGNTLPMGSPDTNIYIRRIRYTPYTEQAVADAYRCASMFACYGAMAPAPMANASLYISTSSSPSASPAAGRHLLQAAASAHGAALTSAVADSMPGIAADSIAATASAFGLSMTVTMTNINGGAVGLSALDTYQSDGLQAALLSGLAGDVSARAQDIMIEDASEDASGALLSVKVLITGYATAAAVQTDYASLAAAGAAALDNAASAVNNALGAVATAYISVADVTAASDADSVSSDANEFSPPITPRPVAVDALLSDAALCPSYPDFWDASCVDAAGDAPSVWCAGCVLMDVSGLAVITTYTVAVQVAASSVDAVEVALNAALNSGTISKNLAAPAARRRLLQSGASTALNVSSVNSLVAQRLLTTDLEAALVCKAQETQLEEWRASAIAFIIGFGVLLIAVFVTAAFLVGKRAGMRVAATGEQQAAADAAAPAAKEAAGDAAA